MKKLMSVLLICIFIISCMSIATAETVVTDMYQEETTEINDSELAKSAPDEIMTEEVVPQAAPDVLPQTGGIPVEAFYGLGIVFIIAAIIVSRKKTKTTEN